MPADPQAFIRNKDRPSPAPPAPSLDALTTPQPTPDYTKRCHFTIQLYSCSHRTWLNKPRIQHVHPHCMLAQVELASFPTPRKDGQKKFHKTHCTNLVTSPKEVKMLEICARCRPAELGAPTVKKGLREFERVVGGEEQSHFGVGQVEGEEDKSDFEKTCNEEAVAVEEDIGKDSEGNVKAIPTEWKEDNSSTKEGDEGKNVTATSSAKERDERKKLTEPTPTRSIFGSLFSIFTSPKPQEPESVGPADNEESMEIWVEVGEDPDWEKIDGKEDPKPRRLWKDGLDGDNDWVRVKSQ